MKTETTQFKLSLPNDVKQWVEARAAQNMRSQGAEIIFMLKERMQGQSDPEANRPG